MGAITIGNSTIVNGQPFQWWQPVAVGITAVIFDGVEHAAPTAAVGLAWVALVSVLFVRLKPGTPSPAENFADWVGYK
jgi:hypothetical protein